MSAQSPALCAWAPHGVCPKTGPRGVYDGVLHQPHTDPETPRILGDVIAWLAVRARA